jgi:hypothetical protein
MVEYFVACLLPPHGSGIHLRNKRFYALETKDQSRWYFHLSSLLWPLRFGSVTVSRYTDSAMLPKASESSSDVDPRWLSGSVKTDMVQLNAVGSIEQFQR